MICICPENGTRQDCPMHAGQRNEPRFPVTDHAFQQLKFVDPDACGIATGGLPCGRPRAEHVKSGDGLPNLLDGTEQFMQLAGQLNDSRFPDDANDSLCELRRNLLVEEVTEYCMAEAGSDLIETVDGLLDIIVIAWGTLLTYIGPEKAKAAAAEVVRSNLSKVDGTLGPIRFREDGKILKPEGWTPPDITGAIAP